MKRPTHQKFLRFWGNNSVFIVISHRFYCLLSDHKNQKYVLKFTALHWALAWIILSEIFRGTLLSLAVIWYRNSCAIVQMWGAQTLPNLPYSGKTEKNIGYSLNAIYILKRGKFWASTVLWAPFVKYSFFWFQFSPFHFQETEWWKCDIRNNMPWSPENTVWSHFGWL